MSAFEKLLTMWQPADEASPPAAPEPQTDQPRPVVTATAQGAEHLEPFLVRVRAEAAGRYVEGMPWPEGGRLVPDPAAHFARYADRFPAGIVAELGALAAWWAAGDRPAADGWPVAPEAYRWEYSRLVAWIKAAPADLSAQVAMWTEGITDHPHPFTVAAQAEPVDVAPTAPATHPAEEWTAYMATLIAWLEVQTPAVFPEVFQLRPGVTVTDAARCLASLRAEAALGPSGIRARRGLLGDDLLALRQLASGHRRPIGFKTKAATPRAIAAHPRREGQTPAEHLAELGGHRGAVAKVDAELAHLLWDAARLWQRDQGQPSAERWEQQYWKTWAIAQEGR